MAKPIQIPFSLLLLLAFISLVFVPAHSKYVYIACGRSDSFTYDGKYWIGDSDFMKYGYPGKVEHFDSVIEPLKELRYFPSIEIVCYVFSGFSKGSKVTVTTHYYYGNYDLNDAPPTFDVQYDENPTYRITTSSNPEAPINFQMTYKVPSSGKITVCFAPANGYDSNTPFVNAIQIDEASQSNVAKIVVPIIVIIIVIIVIVVIWVIYSSKRRMAQLQALQGQSQPYNYAYPATGGQVQMGSHYPPPA